MDDERWTRRRCRVNGEMRLGAAATAAADCGFRLSYFSWRRRWILHLLPEELSATFRCQLLPPSGESERLFLKTKTLTHARTHFRNLLQAGQEESCVFREKFTLFSSQATPTQGKDCFPRELLLLLLSPGTGRGRPGIFLLQLLLHETSKQKQNPKILRIFVPESSPSRKMNQLLPRTTPTRNRRR